MINDRLLRGQSQHFLSTAHYVPVLFNRTADTLYVYYTLKYEKVAGRAVPPKSKYALTGASIKKGGSLNG